MTEAARNGARSGFRQVWLVILVVTAVSTTGSLGLPVQPALAAGLTQSGPPVVETGKSAILTSPIPAGDEVVTALGDTGGWHLFGASAGDGWAWHSLATLRPSGHGDEAWIGQQCMTGDGRFVVAVIAPWHVNNREEGLNHGALAYAIDAHTGAVRALTSGVSLAYFNPGCGTGGQVALTTYPGRNQGQTVVIVMDAASGAVKQTETFPRELTSAVPVAGQVVGAWGSALMRIKGGQASILATLDAPAFGLRPRADGGVDAMSIRGTSVSVWRQSGRLAHRVATGPAHVVQLFAGRGGHNQVAGVRSVTPDSGLRIVSSTTSGQIDAVSLDGGEVVLPSAGGAGDRGLRSERQGKVQVTPVMDAPTKVTTVIPVNDVGSGQLRPAPSPTSPAVTAASPTSAAVAAASTACAVPRDDLWNQVPQPNSAQIDWAIKMGVNGWLTSANIPARPANPQNYLIGDTQPLPAYFPSQDFAPGFVVPPPQVLEGIFAQESNWNQASWHALAGYGGNPLVSDYYGLLNGTPDCGYGVGQVTDNMTVGAMSAATQVAVAVDYAENAAAAIQNLILKWTELHQLGIRMNDDAPGTIDDWYAAIWGYNTGVHTGCLDASGKEVPCGSPSVVTTGGPTGLGWINNPANPMWDPNRAPFLRLTYNDANHPQDWPYQEKVLGWISWGQYDPNNYPARRFAPLSQQINIPLNNAFCTSANSCNPSLIGKSSNPPCSPSSSLCGPTTHCLLTDPTCDPCSAESSSCWWKWSNTWEACPTACKAGFGQYASPQLEPAKTDRSRDCFTSSGLPAGFQAGVVVDADTALTSQNPNRVDPNVIGCSTIPPWTRTGTFELDDQFGLPITASSPAQVDLHQLGVGFGGHTWFTHTANSGSQEVTAKWSPNLVGTYMVSVFVPETGGTARAAHYTVGATGGTPQQIADADRNVDQNVVFDQWVNLGFFTFNAGDTITLRSDSVDYAAGLDVAAGPIAFTPVSLFSGLAVFGDSFSSGEGAADANGNIQPWDPGTDAYDLNGAFGPLFAGVKRWNMCHRSPQAYGRLFAEASPTYSTGPAMFLACSGATTQHMDGNNKGGPQFANGLQLDNLPPSQFVKRILVTAGGNDIGFADIAQDCVIKAALDQLTVPVTWQFLCQNDYPKNASGQDAIDLKIQALGPVLTILYNELAAQSSGDVVVSTYPWILPTFLASGTTSGSCVLYPVAPPDVPWLLNKLQALNATIRSSVQQAQAAGSRVVLNDNATTDAAGNHTGTFAGHELCTTSPYFNNVTPWTVATDYSKTQWTLHPNLLGQQQWARDIP